MNFIMMSVYVLAPLDAGEDKDVGEGVEEEKNDDRDLWLLVNQSHLQRRPIATGKR